MTIVEVTEQDIKDGERGRAYHCPIALALKRKFNTSDVEVNYYTIRIGDKIYATTDTMKHFMEYYDCRFSVEPFTFDLDELQPI